MASWGLAFSDDVDLGMDDRVSRPVAIPALEDAIALAAHASITCRAGDKCLCPF